MGSESTRPEERFVNLLEHTMASGIKLSFTLLISFIYLFHLPIYLFYLYDSVIKILHLYLCFI